MERFFIDGGSGGTSHTGGCITISGGDSVGGNVELHGAVESYDGSLEKERELIKANPCWPYGMGPLYSVHVEAERYVEPSDTNKCALGIIQQTEEALSRKLTASWNCESMSDLDISGPTVEEYLASLETAENYELKIIGGGEITFAAGDCVTKDYIDSMYNTPTLEAGPGLQIHDLNGNQTISLNETIQVQRGDSANPPYSFGEATNTGMFHTGWSLGFTVNGKTLVEVDEYCGLILRTSYGDQIEVSAVLERSQERIDHLMNENVILTNRLHEAAEAIADQELRLRFLETSQPWTDFI